MSEVMEIYIGDMRSICQLIPIFKATSRKENANHFKRVNNTKNADKALYIQYCTCHYQTIGMISAAAVFNI